MNHFFRKTSLSVAVFLMVLNTQAQNVQEKIAPELLSTSTSGTDVECLIIFKANIDLTDLRLVHGKDRKGKVVYQRLKAVAANSQKQVQQLLAASHRSYRSFLIANAIYSSVDRELLYRIAQRPEVKNIQANPWINLIDWRAGRPVAASGRSPVEWGVDLINVPEVWAQGINGAGVVIGGQDTGVEWTHPALMKKYRAWESNQTTIDHRYHWFDAITAISPLHNELEIGPGNNPCGLSVDSPCDDNDHGTFTMGISVGDDEQGNQIGVAPGADWIACRNMERGYGSPATYLAGFEWFLAPTDLDGNNPRPDLAPHVINNSWGCPEMEGCTIDNWGILETAIENLRAAGVVVVVSAGNEGPSCGSVDDPSAIFAGAFAVGATDNTDTLANFSSRGPVLVDNSGRLKPDLVAPGVGIRSAKRNDQFFTASGTSAAGPFVVGVVALMIQANPELAGEVEVIEQILRETTAPAYDTISCSGFTPTDIPNPMTGYGRIDALAAVQRARQVSPAITPENNLQIQVYPNPSRGKVQFTIAEDAVNTTLEVFDATGRLIRHRKIDISPVLIDLSDQPSGLYWWRWTIDHKLISGKLIKQ